LAPPGKYLNDLIQPALPVQPLRSSNTPLLFAARTRTEFARQAFSVAALHTWNLLPSDIRSCHTLHTLKNPSKHTCSDSLNLKPPAPLYPLQDFNVLCKYCIIIIVIIIIMFCLLAFSALLFLRCYYLLICKRPEMTAMTSRTPVVY